MNVRAFRAVCVAAAAAFVFCSFSLLGADVGDPRVAAPWTYCMGLDEGAADWEIQTPSGSLFEVELVGGVLSFRGTADAPDIAPQALLLQPQTLSMTNASEVAVLVDIRELGAVFALDVDDADGRYNWSLRVSVSQVSFGYVDSTCECGSGWRLLEPLDEDRWLPKDVEGEHVLRVSFERGVVRATIDRFPVASFGLPGDLDRAIVRLSVAPPPSPEGEDAAIGSTDVRVLQVCLAEED